jgi:aspartyl-tRNA(Asn)/glutamyl-tRNA(Gln) amidotransferase subunit C
MSRISREQVLHVADLARLALSESELVALTAELDTILEYADSLAALDTEGIEPTSHPLPLRAPLRPDRAEEPLDPVRALANAPERDGSSFRVPRILASDEV